MITKEQFLAGVEFRVKGEFSDFKYEHNCLTSRIIGEFSYCANIRDITGGGFTCFTFLFTEEVSAFVKFSDCTPIVNEPATAEKV